MWPSDRLADGSNIVVPGLTEDELTAKIVPPAPAASHAKGVAALVGLFVGTPKYAVTPLRGKGVTAAARVLRELESHQLQRLETRVAVLADDEVVVHGNAQWPRDLDDGPRHVDVGARGSGIAGGMVVQNQTRPSSTLISFNFCSSPGRRGTCIGGGNWCLFVLITCGLHCSPPQALWSTSNH